jgi:hypothetical protein
MEDAFLIDYAQKLIFNNDSHVSILDSNHFMKNNYIIQNAFESLVNKYPDNITLMSERIIEKDFLLTQDLLIISLESWKKLVNSQSDWLSNIPSVLIIKP